MTALRQALADYLTMRRGLGYKLERAGKLLAQFVAYLGDVGADTVTVEHALAWASLPAGGDPSWWSYRLSVVRGFAVYLRTLDPATEVPAAELMPWRPRRATPYLYSDEEIAALLAAAGTLRFPLRVATYQTLIGLLAVTGLRVGEAIRLDRGDIDFAHELLVVRDSKFGKSREVPLHPSTMQALRAYLYRRDRLQPPPSAPALFISPAGTRLLYCNVHSTFRQLRRRAGLQPRSASCRPRIHDLRHTFAIRTVLDAYRADADVQARLPLLSTYLGHVDPGATYWYVRGARAARPRRAATRASPPRRAMSALAPTLEAFFTDRLLRQRNASAHTVAAYRDTMRLLLNFARERTRRQPSELDLAELDAPLIAAFLDHLERERRNSARTRNARLAAIHSLFRFAALRHPEHAALIQRVLAIPPKRFDRALVTFLTEPEIDALLAAPDSSSWTGRRDHTLFLLAVETGLRASELTGLSRGDLHFGTGAHVSCRGKGRKERVTPLTSSTVATLRSWLAERGGGAADPLFPTRQGRRLSRDALERRLAKYVFIAAASTPTLRDKKVTLHVLRHTAAMRLLHAGVDTSVIALWLGHESVDTTQIYLHADLALKERALARTTPTNSTPGRYRPPDAMLAFLEAL